MSNHSFQWSLENGVSLLWQGCPAPRCYTFRSWLQAIIGTVLFLASSFWLMVGMQLVQTQNYSRWLVLIPLLLSIAAFFAGPGQLILARWRWGKIFYALTDQRLLVRNRLFGHKTFIYQLSDYRGYKQKKYGEKLFSIRLSFQNSTPVILECLEYPENFLNHLPTQKS